MSFRRPRSRWWARFSDRRPASAAVPRHADDRSRAAASPGVHGRSPRRPRRCADLRLGRAWRLAGPRLEDQLVPDRCPRRDCAAPRSEGRHGTSWAQHRGAYSAPRSCEGPEASGRECAAEPRCGSASAERRSGEVCQDPPQAAPKGATLTAATTMPRCERVRKRADATDDPCLRRHRFAGAAQRVAGLDTTSGGARPRRRSHLSATGSPAPTPRDVAYADSPRMAAGSIHGRRPTRTTVDM